MPEDRQLVNKVAQAMIADGARMSIIREVTGLSRYQVRCLWQSMAPGRKPPRGRYPSLRSLLQKSRAQASILGQIMIKVGLDKNEGTNHLKALHETMKIYLFVMGQQAMFGYPDGWMILQGIISGRLSMVRCASCQALVLAGYDQTACCYCDTKNIA